MIIIKENTKYHNYKFVGKINIDEIQPWYDFTSSKPWDEGEIPWMMENKVRREILITLSEGPKTTDELYEQINFAPKPLLVSKDEHECNVKYQWTRKTVENHLLNLEWYNLIKKNGDKYELTFPIFKMENINGIDRYIGKLADNWVEIIKDIKTEIAENFSDSVDEISINALLIEKTVEKIYSLLKREKILPNESNIKALWGEQLRSIKFEDWVRENF